MACCWVNVEVDGNGVVDKNEVEEVWTWVVVVVIKIGVVEFSLVMFNMLVVFTITGVVEFSIGCDVVVA